MSSVPAGILGEMADSLEIGAWKKARHPSGCLEPSAEDLEFTRAIRRAGEMIGIELYDHLIVAGDGYTSFREHGLL